MAKEITENDISEGFLTNLKKEKFAIDFFNKFNIPVCCSNLKTVDYSDFDILLENDKNVILFELKKENTLQPHQDPMFIGREFTLNKKHYVSILKEYAGKRKYYYIIIQMDYNHKTCRKRNFDYIFYLSWEDIYCWLMELKKDKNISEFINLIKLGELNEDRWYHQDSQNEYYDVNYDKALEILKEYRKNVLIENKDIFIPNQINPYEACLICERLLEVSDQLDITIGKKKVLFNKDTNTPLQEFTAQYSNKLDQTPKDVPQIRPTMLWTNNDYGYALYISVGTWCCGSKIDIITQGVTFCIRANNGPFSSDRQHATRNVLFESKLNGKRGLRAERIDDYFNIYLDPKSKTEQLFCWDLKKEDFTESVDIIFRRLLKYLISVIHNRSRSRFS